MICPSHNIINHYGPRHQAIKLIEELGELTEQAAIYLGSKDMTLTDPQKQFWEEMADVKNLIDQFIYYFSKDQEINDIVSQKTKRTLSGLYRSSNSDCRDGCS